MSALTIKSVRSIKNAAVWQAYEDSGQLNSFSRKTLIYGFNGTGKTTLSRILDSLRGSTLAPNLPEATEFEIVLSNDEVISSVGFSEPLGKNLLVFNSDFIARNFKWDESRANPIFYLSEENITKKTEYDAARSALEIAITTNEAARKANETAVKEHGQIKTVIARRVRDLALSGSYSQAYDARKVEAGYAERNYSEADLLLDESLSEKQALLNQAEPLPKIELLNGLNFDLPAWCEALESLLKTSASSEIIKQFDEHAEALNWLGVGLDYHNKHDLDDCLFCGNELSNDRRALLDSLFNTGLKEQQVKIQNAENECQAFILTLRGLYAEVPNANDIQSAEREKFTIASKSFKEITTKAGTLLNKLLEKIQVKKSNLIDEIDISALLSEANVKGWQSVFAIQMTTVNGLITNHNTAYDNFKTLQDDAFQAIRNHIFAEEKDRWNEKVTALDASQTQLTAAQAAFTAQKQTTDKLDNELRKQGIGANKVSDLLKSYLGHADVKLQSVDDGYQLMRADGKPASNLSEGEKTGLAFCFFLTQFEAEGRDKKDLVVIIDDPISSLDTAAKTHAFSLMRKMTKKCAQTIILTHNMAFMNMVKREFRNRNSDEKSGLLQIKCQGDNETSRKSSLDQMNKLLADYDTEYHYLFEIVFNASKNKASKFQFLLPNATRKMLEMFVAFAAPTQKSFAGALGESGVTLVENNLKSLERLVQIESHGTMEGMDNLPALTVEEAIKACSAAIEFIQKRDPKHYKAMKKMCEEA